MGVYSRVEFMKRAFLYIDILGFEHFVVTKSPKIKNIFEILDRVKAYNLKYYFSLQIVVFSDTVLVFNKNDTKENDVRLYATFLVNYAQALFYELAAINVYFKGILTFGEFNFDQLKNIQAYYGLALIDTYRSEKELEGFGLFADKNISNEIVALEKVNFSEKFDFIILCQSLKSLYLMTDGILPIDINLLTDTDECYRIDEDLRFLREVKYQMSKHPKEDVKKKYRKVYDIYKNELPLFFEQFELNGFLPSTISK